MLNIYFIIVLYIINLSQQTYESNNNSVFLFAFA